MQPLSNQFLNLDCVVPVCCIEKGVTCRHLLNFPSHSAIVLLILGISEFIQCSRCWNLELEHVHEFLLRI